MCSNSLSQHIVSTFLDQIRQEPDLINCKILDTVSGQANPELASEIARKHIQLVVENYDVSGYDVLQGNVNPDLRYHQYFKRLAQE